MIILGSNSEVAQAFVEKVLEEGGKYSTIYLVTSNRETTEKFARHLDVKFLQNTEIIDFDLLKENEYTKLEHLSADLLLRDRFSGRRNRRKFVRPQKYSQYCRYQLHKTDSFAQFLHRKWRGNAPEQ